MRTYIIAFSLICLVVFVDESVLVEKVPTFLTIALALGSVISIWQDFKELSK